MISLFNKTKDSLKKSVVTNNSYKNMPIKIEGTVKMSKGNVITTGHSFGFISEFEYFNSPSNTYKYNLILYITVTKRPILRNK